MSLVVVVVVDQDIYLICISLVHGVFDIFDGDIHMMLVGMLVLVLILLVTCPLSTNCAS